MISDPLLTIFSRIFCEVFIFGSPPVTKVISFFFLSEKTIFNSFRHYNLIFNFLATVKISLSPLPHIFITTILSEVIFGAIFINAAKA